ncbi:DNA topoisomerase [Embleya scabrispora]|uniref:DNA topoisomerase n=1 Tax=Embleya scabrispora TaxID=159449 RepID=A0A1T3P4R2_9ACTN|nr:DNA topoisomerase IB [Embleya scabrispora]OPC84053.1 DNA topoisomerase [Embleya scabrispora]
MGDADRQAKTRLRRVDPAGPGLTRRRHGRGFGYLDQTGTTITDAAVLERIRALALPPAWTDVWICPRPDGHIQAVGSDAAGRRQYVYHASWRARRDVAKHDRAAELARHLPRARTKVEEDLARPGLGRERVLAACFHLVDLGFFRSGSEQYARANGSCGLTTLRREHLRVRQGQLRFAFPAKSGRTRIRVLVDDRVKPVVVALRRSATGEDPLFRYRRDDGRLVAVHAADLNAYIRERTGGDFTTKDFRTWHATVLAAVGLAVSVEAADSPTGRTRARARVVREVADHLGNTPAVARASYIDPRVFDCYERGITVARALTRMGAGMDFGDLATRGPMERAVLRMLDRERRPPSGRDPAPPRPQGDD